jgi:hypothetical protein
LPRFLRIKQDFDTNTENLGLMVRLKIIGFVAIVSSTIPFIHCLLNGQDYLFGMK